MNTEQWTCDETWCQRMIAEYEDRAIGVLEMPRWAMLLHWRRAEDRGDMARGSWETLLRAMDRHEEMGK